MCINLIHNGRFPTGVSEDRWSWLFWITLFKTRTDLFFHITA